MSLPAPGCRFYALGACCYQESVNPGLDPDHICLRLDLLMRDWDDFLDRAEIFGLSEEEAARIWNARQHKALLSAEVCGQMRPAEQAARQQALLDCAYLYSCVCLLRLPRCAGRCEHYKPAPGCFGAGL